jgi:hypothetical protein
MSKSLEYYTARSRGKATDNAKIVDKILDFYFDFPEVECVETGVSYGSSDDNFGLYLGKYISDYGGKMVSVDIDDFRVNRSREFIAENLPSLNYKATTQDSVEFIKEYKGSPNLVHLDSYDLNINNPIPSMLHHWFEFVEIKDKMKSGSILLIDDNFFRGTTVYWNTLDNFGNIINTTDVYINYEVVGKGSLVYHAVKEKKIKDWELIGNHYSVGPNHKLIFRKL